MLYLEESFENSLAVIKKKMNATYFRSLYFKTANLFLAITSCLHAQEVRIMKKQNLNCYSLISFPRKEAQVKFSSSWVTGSDLHKTI